MVSLYADPLRFITIVIVVWMLTGGVCGLVAMDKGRHFIAWFIFSLILGPIAWLALACCADITYDRKPKKECPFCKELVLRQALVCKHCGREIINK